MQVEYYSTKRFLCISPPNSPASKRCVCVSVFVLTTGAIIGVCLSVAIVVAMLVFVVFLVVRRRSQRDHRHRRAPHVVSGSHSYDPTSDDNLMFDDVNSPPPYGVISEHPDMQVQFETDSRVHTHA